MGYSVKTAESVLRAYEVITSSDSLENRVRMAAKVLSGISGEEFGNEAQAVWHYISENSEAILDGKASNELLEKYGNSVQQLFEACRPKN